MSIDSLAAARRAMRQRARMLSHTPTPVHIEKTVDELQRELENPPKRAAALKKLLIKVGAYIGIAVYKKALTAAIAYSLYHMIDGAKSHLFARLVRNTSLHSMLVAKNRVTGSRNAEEIEIMYIQGALKGLIGAAGVIVGKGMRSAVTK
jgi:hypothetical protein